MTPYQANFTKAIYLQYLLNSFQEIYEYIGTEEDFEKKIQSKDEMCYALLRAISSEIDLEATEWQKNRARVLEIARKLSKVYRDCCDFYFDDEKLPFLPWRSILRSIRSYRACIGYNIKEESLYFSMFLDFQKTSIEKFVLKNVPLEMRKIKERI